MNKSYKSVWCEKTGTFVAAPEFAKGRKKAVSATATAALALGALFGAAMSSPAQAASTYVGGIFTSLGGGSAKNPTCYSTVYSLNGNTNGGVASGFSGVTQDNVSSMGYYGSNLICGTSDVDTQTNRILAYNTGSSNNATNLSVGGTLYANTAAYLKNANIENLTVTGVFAAPYFVANSNTGLSSGTAIGDNALAIGMGSTSAVGNDSVAMGVNTSASAGDAIAIGSSASASAANALAIGPGAAASTIDSVALGAGSTTTANLALSAYNPGSSTLAGTAPMSEVSMGAMGSERRVTNVAAGNALTDAVNVSQLKSEDDKVNAGLAGAASALGGGAGYNASTGAISAPSYRVAGGTQTNVGDALNALDAAAVQFNGPSGAADVKNMKMVNLADGAVSATSTEAVNGSQLHATNQQVDINATHIADNATAITSLGDSVGTLGNTPLTFAGNSGTVAKKLGETVTIQGAATTAGSYSGANLQTQVDGSGNLQLLMADNLALSSVTAGNTTVDTTGITIRGGPSMTIDGINGGGQKIGNIAAGTADSDAATVGQVNAAATVATADAVKYDDASHGSVTLGNTRSTDGGVTGGTKLTNVAQGQLSSTSTDAVNGSQLHATNQQVAGNATNIASNTTAITNLGDTVNAINSKGAKYFHANSSGADSVASGSESVAIGPNAVASGAYSVAQGAGAKASGAHSVAMGDYSTASKDFAVAMGQNAQANGQQATALGQGATVTADNSTALGTAAQASGVRSIAAGSFSNASGQNSAAFGDFATARGGLSTALGNASTATGDYATAVGNGAAAGAQFATAIGNASSVSGMGGVAIGSGASASQDNSVAIGRRSTTQADLSLPAYNPSASASIAGQTPIGEFSVGAQGMERRITNVAAGASDTDAVNVSQLKASVASSTADAVMYDAASGHNNVTLGGATYNGVAGTGGTKISNVAQGALNATSSDAVNGSQLYATNQQVATNTTNIANNTTNITNLQGQMADAVIYDSSAQTSVTLGGPVSTDGGVTGGTKITNVHQGDLSATSTDGVNGSQLYATNQNVSNIANQINTGSVGLVQQAAPGANLTVGRSTDGVAVDFADKEGNTRTLSNVTAGTAATDAVNVSQLKAAGLVDGNGNTLNAVTYDSPAKDSVTLGGVGATAPVRLKNVADGVDDTDAVNLSQLKSIGVVDGNGNALDAVTYDAGSKRGVVTFGGGANGTLLTNVADGAIAVGSRDAVNGGQIAALQNNLQSQITHIDGRVTNIEANGVGSDSGSLPYVDGNANGNNASNANAGTTAGVAVGYNANATGDNASALGQNATALGSYATAIGNDSYAAGPNDTALGGNAKVHADGSVAVGANATVTSAAATNAVAVGADTQVSAASGTAIGQGAAVSAAATGAVALGQGSVADRANTVSVGTAGGERQITNVAAGTAPTDAVNVSQLQDAQQQSNAYIDNRINQVQSDLAGVKRDANAAASAALAAANLPQSVFPGKSMASAAAGSMGGEAAVAVGLSKMDENGRWVTKLSATVNTRGNTAVGAGIGFYW